MERSVPAGRLASRSSRTNLGAVSWRKIGEAAKLDVVSGADESSAGPHSNSGEHSNERIPAMDYRASDIARWQLLTLLVLALMLLISVVLWIDGSVPFGSYGAFQGILPPIALARDPATIRGFASTMLLPIVLWLITRLLGRLVP